MSENTFGLRDGDKWVKSFSKWAMCVLAGPETQSKCAKLKARWYLRPAILGFNPDPIWAR